MTPKQANTLKMYLTVLEFLNYNNTNWSSNPIIEKAVNNFQAMVVSIQDTSSHQNIDAAVKPVRNDQEKEQLINLAYRLALRVKNYAVSVHNNFLKQSVDFSKNELEAGKETDIIKRCKSIISQAKTVVNAPAGYKILPDFIAQVEVAINVFSPETQENNKAKPINNLTEELENLFNKASTQLHILDDLIEADADDSASGFTRKYFMTRRTSIENKISNKLESDKRNSTNDNSNALW